MNYADIKYPDIQDGEGIRVALYVSGCHFHCKECHNKEDWDFNYGKKFTDETIEYIMDILRKPYVNGLSLLGGEPLEPINQNGILPLVKKAKEEFPEKDIWCWTGYNFDSDILNNMYVKNEVTKELLKYIDIIVDGQFEIDNKLEDLAFRGSTNQRKIDVQKSLAKGKLVRLKFGDETRYETKNPKIMFFEEFKKSEEKQEVSNLERVSVPNYNVVDFEVPENNESNRINIEKTKENIAAKGIENI